MNRTFPAGLQRLADEQQQARVDMQSQQPAASAKKSRRKRKRAEENDDEQGAATGHETTSQGGGSSSPTDRSFSSFSSSSSPSSSSPSSTSPMAPSVTAISVSAVSFDVFDCMWTLRELHWAQRGDEKGPCSSRCEAGASYRAVVTATVAMQRFCLRPEQLPSAEQRVSNAAALPVRQSNADVGDGTNRFGILALVDSALGAHGHASAIVALQARRARISAREASIVHLKRIELLRAIEAAFAQAGAWWKQGYAGGELGIETRVAAFSWCKSSGWLYDDILWFPGERERLHDSVKKRTEYHKKAARVHAAMVTLGWRCKGRCGWGDCARREDALITAEQLATRNSNGNLSWNDSNGSFWYASRSRGMWDAERL